MEEKVKWQYTKGGYRYTVDAELQYRGNRIFIKTGYNKYIIEEIKNMQGAHYHGYDDHNPQKIWSVAKCARNRFHMDYLEGKNVYAWYDRELLPVDGFVRPVRQHQIIQVQYILTYRCVIIAAEMGLGKTLSCIEAVERSGVQRVWYVGPKAGVRAVNLELIKWKAKFQPSMFTYEGHVNHIKNNDVDPPHFIIFDESHKIKNPAAQRSKAAMLIADAMRNYGTCYIVLLTGTPAPKSPLDWWHQCEVVCPGFIREGSIPRFQRRLSIIEEKENLISGGIYPHVITWLDDENKCAVCGQPKNHDNHDLVFGTKPHEYKKSINEVAKLYNRMKGIVLVQFKKYCTDLPEKEYQVIRVKPTPDMIRAMKLIKVKSTRAITALTLLRELSDGFQYTKEETGRVICKACNGHGKMQHPVTDEVIDILKPQDIKKSSFHIEDIECPHCNGIGTEPDYTRGIESVTSPKDEIFEDELDQMDSIGRYVVWGGFTGTIDRLVAIAHKVGWAVLRIDGRGFHATNANGGSANATEFLNAMDRSHPRFEEFRIKYPKICVVGNPEAGGLAITLTASPIELYYSNSFKGDARMQSEDRCHRLGMDENRGLIIKDIICLPSDELVLNNLKQKKKLQNLSMGELLTAMETENVD